MAARQRLYHLVCNVWRRSAWSSFNERVLMMLCCISSNFEEAWAIGRDNLHICSNLLPLTRECWTQGRCVENGQVYGNFLKHCSLVLEHSTGFALIKLLNTTKNSLTLVHAKTIHYLHVKLLSFLLILNKPIRVNI